MWRLRLLWRPLFNKSAMAVDAADLSRSPVPIASSGEPEEPLALVRLALALALAPAPAPAGRDEGRWPYSLPPDQELVNVSAADARGAAHSKSAAVKAVQVIAQGDRTQRCDRIPTGR